MPKNGHPRSLWTFPEIERSQLKFPSQLVTWAVSSDHSNALPYGEFIWHPGNAFSSEPALPSEAWLLLGKKVIQNYHVNIFLEQSFWSAI